MSNKVEAPKGASHPAYDIFITAFRRHPKDTRGNPVLGRDLTLSFGRFIRADLHDGPIDNPLTGEWFADCVEEIYVTRHPGPVIRDINEQIREHSPLEGKEGIRYFFEGPELKAQDLSSSQGDLIKGEPYNMPSQEVEELRLFLATSRPLRTSYAYDN